jgi:glycosyltransferase involved in cell wall biosynthesis
VLFIGHVPQQDLVTYYSLADVYVSMSEHEGFGKPLIESMYLGLPIVAYAAAAVPDTLGDAGVLIRHKDYEAIAEFVHILQSDTKLQERILRRQRQRVQTFLEPHVRRQWEEIISSVRPLLGDRSD